MSQFCKYPSRQHRNLGPALLPHSHRCSENSAPGLPFLTKHYTTQHNNTTQHNTTPFPFSNVFWKLIPLHSPCTQVEHPAGEIPQKFTPKNCPMGLIITYLWIYLHKAAAVSRESFPKALKSEHWACVSHHFPRPAPSPAWRMPRAHRGSSALLGSAWLCPGLFAGQIAPSIARAQHNCISVSSSQQAAKIIQNHPELSRIICF